MIKADNSEDKILEKSSIKLPLYIVVASSNNSTAKSHFLKEIYKKGLKKVCCTCFKTKNRV